MIGTCPDIAAGKLVMLPTRQEARGSSAGSLRFLARILELLPQLGLEWVGLQVVIRGFCGMWT